MSRPDKITIVRADNGWLVEQGFGNEGVMRTVFTDVQDVIMSVVRSIEDTSNGPLLSFVVGEALRKCVVSDD